MLVVVVVKELCLLSTCPQVTSDLEQYLNIQLYFLSSFSQFLNQIIFIFSHRETHKQKRPGS
jgi:hypothetical protein